MPTPEKQVRVFISSTFRDMHAERDELVMVVLPELRSWRRTIDLRTATLGPSRWTSVAFRCISLTLK